DRGERHALLVLTAPRRQLVAVLLEGVAERRDVAVAEDREHAGEQRRLCAVDHGALGDQVADDGFGGGDLHGRSPLDAVRSGRTIAAARSMAPATSPSGGYSNARPTTSPRTFGTSIARSHDAYVASGSGPGEPPRISAGSVVHDSMRAGLRDAGTFSHVAVE